MDREELQMLVENCDQFQAEVGQWNDAIRELVTSLRALGTSLNKRNVDDGKRALLRVAEQAEPLYQHVTDAVEGFSRGFDLIRAVATAEIEQLNSEEGESWQ